MISPPLSVVLPNYGFAKNQAQLLQPRREDAFVFRPVATAALVVVLADGAAPWRNVTASDSMAIG
jgi:hypothetical protein